MRLFGTVQGVGMRPHVHATATALGLSGLVGNDGEGVFLEVEGDADRLEMFRAHLLQRLPALAVVDAVRVETIPTIEDIGFAIVESPSDRGRRTLVTPDAATCEDCLREILDPRDRRYRYAFTNCTNCGPRYSIVQDVPYDRARTTMSTFPLCEACQREHDDPTDRRFHAQPVCCPACGPTLALTVSGATVATADSALRGAAARLRRGEVIAVKGLGGFHLAVLASDPDAAATLRSRKRREERPFAVMVSDLDAAGQLCHLDDLSVDALTHRSRPIVILPRRLDAHIAEAVAPGNRSLGLMLPYTPVHHLLLDAVGEPLVMTSGNLSGEPIAFIDEDAHERLATVASAFLGHDRPIHVRVDDSVVRRVGSRIVPVRRSRGAAPSPLVLPITATRHVLGVGAELKSTVCLARERHAFLSPHLGDLGDHGTHTSFIEAIEHLARLFGVNPTVVGHDLHPDYLSTAYAQDLAADGRVELVGVQHHHAHIASCLVDNGRADTVIGVAFDGTGYGLDGTIWGGEILLADLLEAERVARFDPVPLPGGAAAIREPWRAAVAYLEHAYPGVAVTDLGVARRNADRWAAVASLARRGVNAPLTSSAGRLFDAVAAILDVRDRITYEGQAAIELEQLADPNATSTYETAVQPADGGLLSLSGAALVRAVVDDVRRGERASTVAGRFHTAVAQLIGEACERVRDERGVETVALSGGVFQNALLTERTVAHLEGVGFAVLTHRTVPPNDGGIALGQTAVVAARDAAGLVRRS